MGIWDMFYMPICKFYFNYHCLMHNECPWTNILCPSFISMLFQTPVLMALGVTLMNEDFYPDPEKSVNYLTRSFIQLNLYSDSILSISLPSCAFEPFGFGKRKCLGHRFSMAEFSVAIPSILRSLKIEMVPGQVVTSQYGLVTAPQEEIWIKVSERKKNST